MKPRAGGSDGFTLVETLIAVAVVAFVSVALQRGLVATRLALSRAEAAVAAEAVARGILETRLYDLASAPGERRGSTDGLEWAVKSEPLDLPFTIPPPPPPTAPATAPAAPAQAGDSQDASSRRPRPPPRPQAQWTPLRVTVEVDPRAGPPITVETIHLARVR